MMLERLWQEAEVALEPVLKEDRTREERVYGRLQEAFRLAGIHSSDLAPEPGYGFHPAGLTKLEAVYSHYFQAEAALVRPQMVSGTHALSLALEALVPAGGRLLVATGEPYDSLWPVLGLGDGHPGSLPSRHQVEVKVVTAGRGAEIRSVLSRYRPDVVLIQRSRGYSGAASRPVQHLDEVSALAVTEGALVIVDNCYGEFVEDREPLTGGGGLAVGSLIKNPGGTLAPTGAYAVGGKALVERVAERLFGPALGSAPGPVPDGIRPYVQGLYLAPHLVREAIGVSRRAAHLFRALGYDVDPEPAAERTDLVLRVRTGQAARLSRAMAALQAQMALDAHLRPEPAAWPGYRHPVLMAGAVFVPGGTLELSADAPMRPPFDLFLQGGVSAAEARGPILAMAEAMGPA